MYYEKEEEQQREVQVLSLYGIYLESNDELIDTIEASSIDEAYELYGIKTCYVPRKDWYIDEVVSHESQYVFIESGDILVFPETNHLMIDFNDLHIEDINCYPFYLSIPDKGGKFHILRVVEDKNNNIEKILYKGIFNDDGKEWTAAIYNVDYSVDMNKDDIGFTGHGN